jgi:hypothetical protein
MAWAVRPPGGHGTIPGKSYAKGPIRMRIPASLCGATRCCAESNAPWGRDGAFGTPSGRSYAGSWMRTSGNASSRHFGE